MLKGRRACSPDGTTNGRGVAAFTVFAVERLKLIHAMFAAFIARGRHLKAIGRPRVSSAKEAAMRERLAAGIGMLTIAAGPVGWDRASLDKRAAFAFPESPLRPADSFMPKDAAVDHELGSTVETQRRSRRWQSTSAEHDELNGLQRENRQLRLEREILSKAAA
jgi:hypothetical protein